MRKFFDNFKSGLIIGLGFMVMLLLVGVVYGAWTNISKVNSGDILDSIEWNNTQDNIDYLKTRVDGGVAVPSGAVLAFKTETCPSGWYPADGSVDNLDLRGVFIRGANSFDNGITYNNRDEDRTNAGSGVLSEQGDAIRNITGGLKIAWTGGGLDGFTGVFYKSGYNEGSSNGVTVNGNYYDYEGVGVAGFNAGIQVPTGSDNRPQNIALIYCIKE